MSTAGTPSSQGSPFWRFSLRFYRRPQVADACIALQEAAGVDVNLLLFLLWHAAGRRAFSTAEVEGLERRVGPWRNTTVVPLRALRRALKTPPALVEAGAAEAFRTRIKAVELEAERLQQEAMYELARAAPLGTEAASPQQYWVTMRWKSRLKSSTLASARSTYCSPNTLRRMARPRL